MLGGLGVLGINSFIDSDQHFPEFLFVGLDLAFPLRTYHDIMLFLTVYQFIDVLLAVGTIKYCQKKTQKPKEQDNNEKNEKLRSREDTIQKSQESQSHKSHKRHKARLENKKKIPSQRGVKQGDALNPVFTVL
jgi:4-diphosphocytidyl-2C-methyl-D-erythritol kinase